LISEVERLGARIESVDVSQEGDRRSVGLDVALTPEAVVPELVAKVADVEHVLEVRWSE
jgi:hypothetical protein